MRGRAASELPKLHDRRNIIAFLAPSAPSLSNRSRTAAQLLAILLLMSSFCSYAQPPAQTLSPEAWEGVWNAEQTLITLRVVRSGDQFAVEPLETMGLLWVSRNGMINGNTATIEVEYQGVIGQVLVELIVTSKGAERHVCLEQLSAAA